MSIFMVSRVGNKNGKVVGFGLLDTETKDFRLVPRDELYNKLLEVKLNTQKYYYDYFRVENLKVDKLQLKGTNGSLERYPLIDITGNLLGNASVTILGEILDGDKVIGYTISDYKGKMINVRYNNFLNYAKENGITNGKIVNKNGTNFISAIEGGYIKSDIRGDDKNKSDRYVGEKLIYEPRLKPILCTKYYDNSEAKIMYIGEYDNITNDYIPKPLLSRNSIKFKNRLYQTNEYILYGIFQDEITDIKCINHINMDRELNDILRIKQVRDILDNNISIIKYYAKDNKAYSNTADNTKMKIVPEELLLNDKRYIPEIRIEVKIDKEIHDTISSDTIEEYKNYIRLYNIRIIRLMNFGGKRIALGRQTAKSGVYYRVLIARPYNKGGNIIRVVTDRVSIEAIYENHEDYNNVAVKDRIIIIRGLDGVYSYDMDKLLKEYGRDLVRSTRRIKAKTLGYNHREILYTNGDLEELSIDASTVIVPDDAKNILSKSIDILKNNDKIIFGANIEKCSNTAISENVQIKYNLCIEINSNEEVGLNIVKSFRHSMSSMLTFHFNRDISTEEYANIVYNATESSYGELDTYRINIIANNIDRIGDKFIVEVMNYYLKNELDNLEVLNTDNNSALLKFKRGYRIVIRAWRGFLNTKVSEGTATKINRMFKMINNLISIKNKGLLKADRIKIEKITVK